MTKKKFVTYLKFRERELLEKKTKKESKKLQQLRLPKKKNWEQEFRTEHERLNRTLM